MSTKRSLFINTSIFLLLVFLCIACFVKYQNQTTSTKKETKNYSYYNVRPSTYQGDLVKHTYYTLSYSEKHEQAEWVAYHLKPAYLIKNTERKDNFKSDPLVKTGSAQLSDYRNSGYDRGHLLPSADMAFSEQANSETFYLSNMSPQEASFNRGVWKKLEEQVRDYVMERGELYIMTGPVLSDSLKEIGSNGVDVPDYYYKIVADIDSSTIKTIAYLLKNEKSDLELERFIVSIDSIETMTHIDFFVDFPDSLEAIFESKKSLF